MELFKIINDNCQKKFFTGYMNYILHVIRTSCSNDDLALKSWTIRNSTEYFFYDKYDVDENLNFKL